MCHQVLGATSHPIIMYPCSRSSKGAGFVLGHKELWPVLSSLTHVDACDLVTGGRLDYGRTIKSICGSSLPPWVIRGLL